ncbi:amidohydrolase family protein [Croceicoccus naphthovorans]|nr:amidohydrolase family protein [Croceicoccus naphthovorans]MBB3991506.1 imidazolonepropionase-like amidohydrolase [Croceicoccus naphthovorans]
MRLLLAIAALFVAPLAHAETIAITHAHVMDGAHEVQDATIVVSNGRIASVSAKGPVPADARVIDVAGRPVTPALSAAATQIGIVGIGGEDSAVTSGALNVSRAVDPNALTIQDARALGVAHAMVFPSTGSGAISGSGAMLYLKPGADPVETPVAAVFAVPAADQGNGSRSAAWAAIRDALNDTSDADLNAVVAGRIPLAIKANRESDILQAIALSREFGIRVVVMGGAEAWRVADELASSKVAVIVDPLDDLPFTYDSIASRRDNAAILSRAGVRMAFMVSGLTVYLSYNVGTALREGAGLVAANGLSRAEALRAITTGPSLVWTGNEAQGLVAGAPADLVIWDGDPLEPASAADQVIIAGKEVSPVTRRTMLRDRYHPSRMNDPLPPAYR